MKLHLPTSTDFAAASRLVAISLVIALCTVLAVPSAWCQEPVAPASSDSTEGGSASSAGMGAAAGLSTLLYLPL